MEQLVSPPRTIMEVYKMLPEGTLAEIIDGVIFMSPAPTLSHQDITTRLIVQFGIFLQKRNIGKIYAPPVDIFFDEQSNAVQPDLVFVLTANYSILKQDAIHGCPDLIVEVLSPGNRDHDRIKKKLLYEKFAVKEYWLIDSETKEATGYFLENSRYEQFSRANGKLSSRLLDHTFEF